MTGRYSPTNAAGTQAKCDGRFSLLFLPFFERMRSTRIEEGTVSPSPSPDPPRAPPPLSAMSPTPSASRSLRYRPFDPLRQAALSLDHLLAMTDPKLGHLPYGHAQPYVLQPFAEHSRQDDAEFAATWYEGISCAREMLGTDRGKDVEDALRALVLDPACWEDATGLRYPARRPWTGDDDYCALSEMGPVLSALDRMIETNPADREAADRARGLVAGLRRLVVAHERRLTPAGTFPADAPVYSFPSDVAVRGRGLAPELSTGFADWTMRVSTLIHPVMVHYDLTGDEASLDLARGLSNFVTGFSHFFSSKTEFQGEVHSALVAAAGLARLGRVLSQDRYVARAKSLYDYVRRKSSAFGWVPEFLQWQLLADERCDAACIVDMMICALELVECNFPEYWDDVHRFWRNHLVETQFDDTSFVAEAPAGAQDTDRRTYRDLPARLRGGFCGAAAPAFVFLNVPRVYSGRGSAAGPRGMLRAWRHAVEINRDILTVNFPIDIETDFARISVGYPNRGEIRIVTKRPLRINLRVYTWMSSPHEGTIDDKPAGLERREDHISFPKCRKGSTALFSHVLPTARVPENISSLQFWGIWRGPDMVDILPHGTGPGYRLYQCAEGVPREPIPRSASAADEIAPFCEPPVSKETRLNRRKAPRA